MDLKQPISGVLSIALIATALSVHAVIWDRDREQSNAKALAENLDFGQVIWIPENSNHKFPAIYTPSGPYGGNYAVILLHSMGGHPDWPVVISPLRKSFRYSNWSTLSLQLPVLDPVRNSSDYGRTLQEAASRIGSGIDYLHQMGHEHVYLVGYGFGATAAAYYLDQNHNQVVPGFVAISILARKFLNPKVDVMDLLKHIDIPVLDIYASNDQKTVVQSAVDRRLAINNGDTSKFTQIEIPDTDHLYTNSTSELYHAIHQWLEQTAGINENRVTSQDTDGGEEIIPQGVQ